MSETITVDLLRSTWDEKYTAISIDGIRHGPDAGPWTVEDSWAVPVKELAEVVERHERNG